MERPRRGYMIILGVLVALHAVGLVGLTNPAWQELFLTLTPIHLTLSLGLVLSQHHGSFLRLGFYGAAVALSGWFVEYVGVHTGFPFGGEYTYGWPLGPQLLDVPFVIGLNWLLLAYCSGELLRSFFGMEGIPLAFVAALLMTALDFLIEPVAQSLNFWRWEGGEVPLMNYLGWFVCALLIQMLLLTVRKLSPNRSAAWLFILQVLFFGILFFFLTD